MKATEFKIKKKAQEKIVCLTCYDYPSARLLAETALDCILVGDSVAMAVHGYESTVMATMEMMVMHTQAVARGLGQQFLISDMPFLSYQISHQTTMRHVMQLMQAGAHAVKIEGGDPALCETMTRITRAGVPVIGHIGMTPQSVHQFGGFRVQGKELSQAANLMREAKALEEAGAIALVLECVPAELAKRITEQLSIPTIGIGAGCDTDGQILVWHDVLGLQDELKPKFVKHYAQGKHLLKDAVSAYVLDVKQAVFPEARHMYCAG